MRLLIIIGAGTSFDCWPKIFEGRHDVQKLPLANELFSNDRKQSELINLYRLGGLASKLRSRSRTSGDVFDIEAELTAINDVAVEQDDKNYIQALFTTRFYLQHLIKDLTNRTLELTDSVTLYIELLNKLKDWVLESRNNRFVDIVTFNYDTLLEDAMENVYPHDWRIKNDANRISAYYQGANLKIFKPHGSIDWGREITKDDKHFQFYDLKDVVKNFNTINLANSIKYISPDDFINMSLEKNYVPAIAVPFKGKTDFQECPKEMLDEMVEAIKDADKVMTLGWKGTDKHFTEILKTKNKKVDKVFVVSPDGETQLETIYPSQIKPIRSTFSNFISETDELETILQSFGVN